MNSSIDMIQLGQKAKKAWKEMARASTSQKNKTLEAIAKNLECDKEKILAANEIDISDAKTSGMDEAMLDRLILKGRLEAIIEDTKKLIALPDPVGKILEERTLPNGLHLSKRRTSIGVIGVIYESRPNVTIDVSALTIKTGNCAILRAGSETLHSSLALVKVIRKSLRDAGLPEDAIQLIESSDRSYVSKLLHMHDYVDLIIPRGGAGLHQFCRDHSKIPVITGGIGICHLFVDASAHVQGSLEVIYNAKTQRPTVCNALDTVLLHKDIAAEFLPKLLEKLGDANVKFKVDSETMKWVKTSHAIHAEACELAHENEWDIEWLSLVLGIKIVDGIEDAITHIQAHSTGHSDGILTEDKTHAQRFIDEIDSCAVYVNASTRFTDGGQFGLGAEVAISTQKLHARGPMGLEELTTYKWVVEGNYQTRQ